MEEALSLSVDGDDPLGALEDLGSWLRQEPELRGHVRQVSPPPAPGHMGSLTEIVIAAAGGGGVLVVLAESLKTWLSRPRNAAAEVKIRRTRDGEEITITARHADELEAILRSLSGPREE